MPDATLGDLAFLRIDPSLDPAVKALWQHPYGDTLRFTYVDFEQGVGESVAPNYADTDVIGRAEPYKAFVGLPSREITLNFTFQVQDGDLLSEVVMAGRFLDALKYPLYSPQQDLSYPPPACILKIGALLTARVVLTGGDPQWKGPVDPDTLLPHTCEFQATFSVVRRFQADLGYRFQGQWQ